MADSLLARLVLALAIGMIVGVERGWTLRELPDGSRVAGIRTYALSALLGGVAAAVADAMEAPLILAAGLLAFAGVFALFQTRDADRRNTVSATAAIAGLAVFCLGALAVLGDMLAAGAAGVAMACVLASRQVLHGLLRRMSWVELRSALLLLAMTLIVLPLLPNRTVDPWGGINPWEIWFFTVLTAAISFAGYITIRLLGPGKGILVSAVLGGIVSSTAVTIAFGRRARRKSASEGEAAGQGDWRRFAGGAALAAMSSVTRVLVIVLVVKPELGLVIAAPALAGAVTFGLIGGLLVLRGKTEDGETRLGNPFDLGPLLLFVGGFVVIAGASAAAAGAFGPGSVVVTSGLTGIFDVDVAALTASRLAGTTVPFQTAAQAVLLAIALNACGRLVAAGIAGPWRYTALLSTAAAAAIAVGAGVAFVAGPLG